MTPNRILEVAHIYDSPLPVPRRMASFPGRRVRLRLLRAVTVAVASLYIRLTPPCVMGCGGARLVDSRWRRDPVIGLGHRDIRVSTPHATGCSCVRPGHLGLHHARVKAMKR